MKTLKETYKQYKKETSIKSTTLSPVTDINKQDPVLIEMLTDTNEKKQKVLALVIMASIESKKQYFVLSFNLLNKLIDQSKQDFKIFPVEYKTIFNELADNPFIKLTQKGTGQQPSSFELSHELLIEQLDLDDETKQFQKETVTKFISKNNTKHKEKNNNRL